MIDIRKLAEQAGAQQLHGTTFAGHFSTERALQRFADLVLEEAAKVSDDEAYAIDGSGNRYTWSHDCRVASARIRALKSGAQ